MVGGGQQQRLEVSIGETVSGVGGITQSETPIGIEELTLTRPCPPGQGGVREDQERGQQDRWEESSLIQ